MTFVAPAPNQTYHPRVYAAFGSTIDDDPATWVWTDITKYARPGLGAVTLSGGRPALSGTADPSQITLVLDNTDGRFTARSPLLRNGQPNPYWPNVVKNTPLKVAVTWDGAVAEYELLTAFVNGWPLQPVAGLINVSVPITASGRLRRLRKTNKVARSALYRAITIDNNITYDGYWSMEDAAGSNRFVSVSQATPIHDIPMTGIKRPALASNVDIPGSAPLTDFSGGIHATATPANVNSGNNAWIVDHVLFVGDTPSGSGLVTLLRIFLPTCSYRIELDLTNQRWQVEAFDNTGANFDTQQVSWAASMSPFDGQPHLIRLRETANILTTFDLLVDNVVVLSFTETITNSGDVRLVGIAGVATSFPLVIGHLLIVNNALPAINNTNAMLGFPGEGTQIRVQRLCNEENIPVTIIPNFATNQPRMGPQLINTVSNLLDEVADLDDALLHDAGPNGNLVYAGRGTRYNAAVGMSLDYQRHQIGDGLGATYDDQDLITSTTISRTNGSSTTVTSTTTTDLYAVEDTVNCETDAQTGNIAGWRTHIGTYDAYRLPTIDINMRTTPELTQAATTVELPFRLSPINIPSPYPPGSLDQFAEAFVTTLDSVEWRTEYSCVPYGPYQVAVYGESRYDSPDSELSLGLGPQVAANPLLNTGFEAGVTGWTPTACTFVSSTTHPHTGTNAALLTVVGTPSQAFARFALPVAITPGDLCTVTGWVFATSALANVQISIDWLNSSGGFLANNHSAPVTLTANVYKQLGISAVAPAGAASVLVGATIGGSPASGTQIWVDDIRADVNATLVVNAGPSGTLFTDTTAASILLGATWANGSIPAGSAALAATNRYMRIYSATTPTSWTSGYVTTAQAALAPGGILHFSFKSVPTSTDINTFMNGIPPGTTVWLTYHHEDEQGTGGDIPLAQYQTDWATLRTLCDAHPKRSQLVLVGVLTEYKCTFGGENWQDWWTGHEDRMAVDCYNLTPSGNAYRDPSDIWNIASQIASVTGIPCVIPEYGALLVTGDTTGSGRVACINAQMNYLRNNPGIVDAVSWFSQTVGSGIDLASDPALESAWRAQCNTVTAGKPYDIWVSGEQMTVTDVDQMATPQTIHVTRAVNGMNISHAPGDAVHVYPTPYYAL